MAAYEVLLLNTAIPQIQAAQSGDTYVVPRDIAINATAIISANSATDALRITQIGAGNAILVEDSANPDATPFVVTAAGDVGIGTDTPQFKLDVFGKQRIYLNNTSVGNASSMQLTQDGTGDAAVSFLIGSATEWLVGVDNSASDAFKISNITGGGDFTSVGIVLDSSGNLGLGVTPSAWASGWRAFQNQRSAFVSDGVRTAIGYNWFLDSGATNRYIANDNALLYQQVSGQHIWYNAPSGTAGNAISFTQAMTLDASGNLGVGETSPSSYNKLTVNDNIGLVNSNSAKKISFWSTANGISENAKISVDNNGLTTNTGVMSFWTKDGTTLIERARITSGGNLLVQTDNSSTTAGVGVKINASATAPVVSVVGSASTNADPTYLLYSTGAAAYRFYVDFAGNINATNTTIAGISDQRLKENIRDLDVGLDAILALKPRKFDWKAGKGKDKKDDRGFIAQEFEQVFPDLVDKWLDPAPEGEEPYKSVRPDLIPVLVKAVQEQQAMIKQLEAKVAALEGV